MEHRSRSRLEQLLITVLLLAGFAAAQTKPAAD